MRPQRTSQPLRAQRTLSYALGVLPFSLRPLAEAFTHRSVASVEVVPQVQLVTGQKVMIAGEAIELPAYVDNTRAPRDLGAFKKRRPGSVDPRHKTTICVHNTGVKFGTSSASRKAWHAKAILKGFEGEVAVQWAAAMALFERFWDAPYHYVGLSCGYVLRNNPWNWHTFHGGIANRSSIGWALEGLYPAYARTRSDKHTAMSDTVIQTGQNSLRLAVLEARGNGCPIRFVQPHRCYSKKRLADPGEEVWKQVVLPVARELDLYPDYHLHDGDGLPIPQSWDPDAKFTDSGKPMRS
jgi:hypothetical protein